MSQDQYTAVLTCWWLDHQTLCALLRGGAESQKKHFAEIGVHLHMYQTFVEGAGVEFRIKPSVSAKQAKGSFDRSGYSVPMSA